MGNIKVKALRDYQVPGTFIFTGKPVMYNIRKDSTYSASRNDGHYKILEGNVLFTAPAELFAIEQSAMSNIEPIWIYLVILGLFIGGYFAYPFVIKRLK